jgi:hypothetical protein
MGKLEDMAAALFSPHMIEQKSWQVKLRQINRDTVLPRQVGGGTALLSGINRAQMIFRKIIDSSGDMSIQSKWHTYSVH